jgi:hypothetical protein
MHILYNELYRENQTEVSNVIGVATWKHQ